MNELERAWKEAYSIENMAGHDAEGRDIDYIGQIPREGRIYLLYRDDHGDYWYRVKIQTPQGIIEEDTVFRRKRR